MKTSYVLIHRKPRT